MDLDHIPGLIKVRVGDVIKGMNGEPMIVDFVNECRARCFPLAMRTVVIEPRFGEKKEFAKLRGWENITTQLPPESFIERRGEQGLKDFLAAKRRGAVNQNENEKGNMKEKKEKKNETTETPQQEGTRASGALGEIFGYSTTAILRRLGAEGVSVAHAREIMKARKVKVADATVSIQVGKGRNGDKKLQPADITKAQVKELVDSAPEPKPEPKAKKPEKKGGKGKGKAKPAAEKPAAPAAEATAPAVNTAAYTS